jgi:hypothetical protein
MRSRSQHGAADGKLKSSKAEDRRRLGEAAAIVKKKEQEFEAILAAYQAEFHPRNCHEEFLVRELALADCCLQRYARVARLLSAGASRNAGLSALVRAQKQARRTYDRTLKELKKIRAGKAGSLPAKKVEVNWTDGLPQIPNDFAYR